MHYVLKVRAVTPETIDKVHMILFDRVKMREIAKVSQLSKFILFCIIKLNTKKLSTRWMLCLLITEQKRIHVQTSVDYLEVFKKNGFHAAF